MVMAPQLGRHQNLGMCGGERVARIPGVSHTTANPGMARWPVAVERGVDTIPERSASEFQSSDGPGRNGTFVGSPSLCRTRRQFFGSEHSAIAGGTGDIG